MPRIDPQQLLACLTPLLAVNGGIKSSGEVIRLANLMEKYSKKLVSKCIYIQILKCTETDLLGQFMAAGGWNLVHTWLNDGVNSTNWAFVQEILEMLLLCPVDGNRLKSNHTPKIVKNLSLNLSQNAMITALSKKLVEQWLKIAHQEKQILQQQNGLNGTVIFNNINSDDKSLLNNDSSMIKSESEIKISPSTENNINNNNTSNNNHNNSVINGTIEEDSPKKSSENVKYKISNKESGFVLSIKRSTSPITEQDTKVSKSPDSKPKSKSSSSSSSSDKDKSKKSSSSSSSHKSSSSSKSSHRDKDRSSSSHKSSSSSSKDRHKDHSSKSSSSSKHSSSSSSSSSRDKDKDREKRKKEQAEKEQAEKDKETLSFLAPLPSSKLQRIPKRPHSESEKSDSDPSSKSAKSNEVIEKKKPSISIEVRKGDKPKTVKTHNSTFRDHGLAEQPPPPPSRKALKKPAPVTPVILPVTTPTIQSPKSISPPPAKRIHLEKALESEVPERIGGVKLIKPKPMLMESSGFLDALETSAMLHKKDSKKRKRLPSGSSGKKDEPESPKIETKPLKFYKDTLEDEEKDEKLTNGTSSSPTKDIENSTNGDASPDEKSSKGEESKPEENSEKEKSEEAIEDKEEEPEQKRPPGIGTGPDGPPGIISIPKRKRPKRSLRWRTDDDLTEVRYFELDENERVNVTKTFNEQKQDEHTRERMMMRSKVVEFSEWHTPKLIDNVPEIPYGSKSLEAAVQAERERNTLQEMFFNNRSMYDSPHEPDPEEYETLEPQIIPLEDVTGNPDSVNNFKDVQWPAPKGEQPQYISQGGFGSLFSNINLASSINIPPAVANSSINPLAGLNFAGLQTAIPQDNAAINFMGIGMVQPTLPPPFMQPPPMIQNNYQSNIPYQNRGSSSGNNSNYNNRDRERDRDNFINNNNNRNRMGSNSSGGGSNWVRGNATLRRGMCHQYQRTGFCRNQKSGCPYVHER